MEPITTPAAIDHPHHQDRKKGHGSSARRSLFPRASGLPRGKVRNAGAAEHAIKTDVWSLSM